MSYITVSNAMKVLVGIDYDAVKELEGNVYKKPIYFFNKRETRLLLGLKELYRDPENFVKEYYKPIVKKDTFRYIFEGGQPAYHVGHDCSRLLSNFKNFEVPTQIREKGEQAVLEFREWFKTVQKEFNEKPDVFEMLLFSKYGIQVSMKAVDYSNSGVEEKENLDLPELERRIDNILTDAGRFYREQDGFHQNIIKRFSKLTFLAYSYKEIYSNDTGMKDADLKAFLESYDIKFKKPLKELLREYYRVLHNHEMKFEGKLLEALGFRPCGVCHGQLISSFFDFIDNEIPSSALDDDLLF